MTPSTGREKDGPIYIGGLDRSGKTTLAGFLASHSRIAIPAVGSNMETYFYEQFGDLRDKGNFERCLQAMMRYKHVRFLDPDPDRIRREFFDGPATYPRLFSLFLIHFAERVGKPRWGAQTGLVERYADPLFAAHPGLKIVHVVRDPRDRYEASLARWPEGKGRAGGATARWRYSLSLARRNARRHPRDYLLIRFEDLVTDTESTLRGVCGFLGEAFEPRMLAMEGAPKLRAAMLSSGVEGPGGSLLSPRYIGQFHGRVPPEEVAFIQLHAARQMRELGYSLSGNLLGPLDRVRFAFLSWPDQVGRMVAWRAVEELQQRFPRRMGRKPGARMILEAPAGART